MKQSPTFIRFLCSFTHVFPHIRFMNVIDRWLQQHLRKGRWFAAVAATLAHACIPQAISFIGMANQLTAMNRLSSELTRPFQSSNRKRSTLPVVCSSPKYMFKRGNNTGMASEIRDAGSIRIEMSRKPISQEDFIKKEKYQLEEDSLGKIVDEVGWGTSEKPVRRLLRGHLQNNPLVAYFFRGRLGDFSAEEKRAIKRNLLHYGWLRSHNPMLEFRMPKKVKDAVSQGAKPKQIIFLPPDNASKKVVMCLVLEGPASAFKKVPTCTPSHPHSRSSNPPVDAIGVDVNQLGKFPMEFGALSDRGKQVHLSLSEGIRDKLDQIVRWATKLEHVDRHISVCQRSYHGERDLRKKTRIGNEIRNQHKRRAGIKRAVDVQASLIIYEIIFTYRPRVFGVEDLATLTTRGKRGKLAKVITWMVKRWEPIISRVEGWVESAGVATTIIPVDARHTSQKHHGCGGVLERKPSTYHVAPCKKCGEQINSHRNAALNIAQRAQVS